MVEDRIRNIESRVQSSQAIPEAAKAELLDLLAALRTELHDVKSEHLAHVENAGDAKPADTLDALTALEATHPRLASLANRIAVTLSNMGI